MPGIAKSRLESSGSASEGEAGVRWRGGHCGWRYSVVRLPPDLHREPPATRGNVHGMPKKVIQFPTLPPSPPPASAESPSRVTIQLGSPRYAVDISCKASEISSAAAPPARPGSGVLIETRFLRLRKAVPLGDRVDGWRVCWIGGWDKGKVFFVVMVKRTVTHDKGTEAT